MNLQVQNNIPVKNLQYGHGLENVGSQFIHLLLNAF
jgi:hypothetical protein